ncbi:MAG: T9SS type A sorting domain-containing protein, partial [Flavobacteriales bacterium]|nr:T9SS type A sorting domain-containing protein [Flavobacteriales bacterium]
MMRYMFKLTTLVFAVAFLSPLLSRTQSLPIDFEADFTTADFVDFDGGTATVIDNPQSEGVNTSLTVAQIVRDGGEIWAGSKVFLDENLDFTTESSINMMIWTTAPIGTVVKFKLEGNGTTERDAVTSTSGEWEELSWDFTGEPANFNELVFMFDFGNVGDGSETSTFLFDNIKQVYSGTQIDLPVDFEETQVNYELTDFGGNASTIVEDPYEAGNTCAEVVKTVGAATWAGTTIGTPAGFATDIPLTLVDSKMSARVWSPEAGTPIRLKVEDSDDPTHTCETETNTTLSGEWEVIVFDFANEAPGTQTLEIGLGMGWTYNMASIFFNFGTEGSVAGEQTYYFDDVQFGEFVVGVSNLGSTHFSVFPNPTQSTWTIVAQNHGISLIRIFDLEGKEVLVAQPNTDRFNLPASDLPSGVYFAQIYSPSGVQTIKL